MASPPEPPRSLDGNNGTSTAIVAPNHSAATATATATAASLASFASHHPPDLESQWLPMTPSGNYNSSINNTHNITTATTTTNPNDPNGPNDPFGLSSAYKSDSELAQIRANTSRKRNAPPLADTRRAHQIKGFYHTQNAAIARMLKSVEQHRADAKQEQGEDRLRVRIAVWGSFAANVVLSGLQLYAAVSSGSLSLFATMIDAVFDPLSNVMLITMHRAVGRVDSRRFPAGKARLETVGNIVFSFLMVAVGMVIVAFAVRELVEHGGGGQGTGEDSSNGGDTTEVKRFHLPSLISVLVAFATKLGLLLYCWTLKDRYSQVRILWQDHRNDLFVNGFGILTSVGGSKLRWWIDPAGATVLSLAIAAIWLRTILSEFKLLVGVVAPVETQQFITYVCLTHSDAIRGIDTVRVYHSGPRLIAEVDIVMDPACSLVETHDVAEALQIKLESLPDVERSFVHVDFETSHSPEHSWKKDL